MVAILYNSMVEEESKRTRNDTTITKRFGKDQYEKLKVLMEKLKEKDDRRLNAVTTSETAFISYVIDMGIDAIKMVESVK